MKIQMLCALLLTLVVGCASSGTHANGKIKVLVLTGGHEFKAEPFFKMFKDDPEITYAAATQGKTAEAYDREDLFYRNMHMRGQVTPLLKTGDELLAWTRVEKKSRVVGIIVGHGCYEDPNFLKLLSQSIRWTARR